MTTTIDWPVRAFEPNEARNSAVSTTSSTVVNSLGSGIDLARSGVGCLLIEVCDGDLCGFARKDDGDFLSDAEILIVVSVPLRRSPNPPANSQPPSAWRASGHW